MRVTVIDYRAGNLTSVVKALRALEAEVVVTEDPEARAKRRAHRAARGGSFCGDAAAGGDRNSKPPSPRPSAGQVPFSASASGLQWLFAGSTEAPECNGLAALPGSCRRFAPGRKVPHVGWNSLSIRPESRLLAGIEDGSFAYFTHSWWAPVGDCDRGGHHLWRALQRGRRARQRHGRAVPPGEIRRDGPAGAAQFSGVPAC